MGSSWILIACDNVGVFLQFIKGIFLADVRIYHGKDGQGPGGSSAYKGYGYNMERVNY